MSFMVKYLQDMPNNCSECPCSIHITKDEVYCNALQKHFKVTDTRPDECCMIKNNEWHSIKKGTHPEIKEYIDEDGDKTYKSDKVLIRGSYNCVPDHIDSPTIVKTISLGCCYKGKDGSIRWFSDGNIENFEAWKYIDLM